MMNDVFELIKELEIKRVTVAGYKDKHYMEIELSKDDLTRFETQYLQFYINKVEELRKDKLDLEEDVQKLINKIGELNRILKDSISLEEFQAMEFIINNERIHNKRLEKALDKACELLEKNVTEKVHHIDECGEFDLDEPVRTRDGWKEYLLTHNDCEKL